MRGGLCQAGRGHRKGTRRVRPWSRQTRRRCTGLDRVGTASEMSICRCQRNRQQSISLALNGSSALSDQVHFVSISTTSKTRFLLDEGVASRANSPRLLIALFTPREGFHGPTIRDQQQADQSGRGLLNETGGGGTGVGSADRPTPPLGGRRTDGCGVDGHPVDDQYRGLMTLTAGMAGGAWSIVTSRGGQPSTIFHKIKKNMHKNLSTASVDKSVHKMAPPAKCLVVLRS